MTNMVVGLLDSRSEVEKVVRDLMNEGFDRTEIHVMASDDEQARDLGPGGRTEPTGTHEESGFRLVLEKLGLLEERRRDIGLPSEDIGYYSEGVRRGGMLVTVDADDEDEVDRAVDILEDHGAVNVEERAAEWQRSGWTAPPRGEPATVGPAERPVQAEGETTLPVVEEELKVGKRAVQRGGVRVYTHVTETPVSETVSLREEHVDVERRPVDRPLTGSEQEAFKEGVIELTETAEEAVVAKEARVVEEVAVSKEVEERTETVQDTVRRTDVEVEELAPGEKGPASKPKQ